MLDIQKLNSRSLELSNPQLELIEQQLESPVWKNAIRLYARKKQVTKYNEEVLQLKLKETGLPIYVIKCNDQIGSEHQNITIESIQNQIPKDPDKTSGLQNELWLTVGTRILLRYNLNIADGLYNGACGTIVRIDWPNNQPSQLPQITSSNTYKTRSKRKKSNNH